MIFQHKPLPFIAIQDLQQAADSLLPLAQYSSVLRIARKSGADASPLDSHGMSQDQHFYIDSGCSASKKSLVP